MSNAERRLTEDEKEVLAIFMFSFRHSQGSPDFQRYFFEYAARVGFLRNLRVSETPPAYIYDYLRVPKQHKWVDRPARDMQVDQHWGELRFYVQNPGPDTFSRIETLVAYISQITIGFDVEYQTNSTGRFREARGKLQVTEYDSYDDPRASHIRRYAVLGHPAGHTAYDHLYAEIAGWLDQNQSYRLLPQLVSSWEGNHLGAKFFPENWQATRGTHRFARLPELSQDKSLLKMIRQLLGF